jgi:signal transduction histidine kinase
MCGWFMAKRALSGVAEVTRAALEISKGAFERRVTVKDQEAEVTLLASAFNTMLDRINTLFREMKEMNNNIAHDLRSPLARIRGAAEMALTSDISAEEGKVAAAGMIEECDRLLGMINTMLDIAEAEAGMDGPKRRPVDMAQVILNACNLFMPVAEEKGIDMTNASAGGGLVMADARMLQRLVSNLLDNALKYTPAGGKVSISTLTQDEHVIVRLQDSGIGISEKDLPHIFDKFYRCDRSRAAYGSGLGLSLSKAIVATHGGVIDVASRFGEGTTFTVTLPRATESETLSK